MLRAVDSLIDSGALELTGGPYPLVRRPAGAQAATARDAELRAQVRALGRPGAEEGVPFLARVLAAAEDPELRALAAEALGDRRRRARRGGTSGGGARSTTPSVAAGRAPCADRILKPAPSPAVLWGWCFAGSHRLRSSPRS